MSKICYRSAETRGFTLIEVLIALAITSMVVSVLMSAVFFGAKVQVAIRQELTEREQLLRSKTLFTEAIASCLPADAASGASFVASAQEITCDSLTPLSGKRFLAPERITFGLKSDTNGNQQLVYRQQGEGSPWRVIAELPTGMATFTFTRSDDDVEITHWPVTGGELETLPRRVRLVVKKRADEQPDFDWVVGVRASPWIEPVPAMPFGLNLPK